MEKPQGRPNVRPCIIITEYNRLEMSGEEHDSFNMR